MSLVKKLQASPTAGNPVYIEDLVALNEQSNELIAAASPKQCVSVDSYGARTHNAVILSGFERMGNPTTDYTTGYMLIDGNIYGFSDTAPLVSIGSYLFYGSYLSDQRTDLSGKAYYAYKTYELRAQSSSTPPQGFTAVPPNNKVGPISMETWKKRPINLLGAKTTYQFGERSIPTYALPILDSGVSIDMDNHLVVTPSVGVVDLTMDDIISYTNGVYQSRLVRIAGNTDLETVTIRISSSITPLPRIISIVFWAMALGVSATSSVVFNSESPLKRSVELLLPNNRYQFAITLVQIGLGDSSYYMPISAVKVLSFV